MEKKAFIKAVRKNFKKRGEKYPTMKKLNHWYELYMFGHDCKYLENE
jgi:hypothetical protein